VPPRFHEGLTVGAAGPPPKPAYGRRHNAAAPGVSRPRSPSKELLPKRRAVPHDRVLPTDAPERGPRDSPRIADRGTVVRRALKATCSVVASAEVDQ
jgi:hypothetical protein